jgi:hypothetical protein
MIQAPDDSAYVENKLVHFVSMFIFAMKQTLKIFAALMTKSTVLSLALQEPML